MPTYLLSATYTAEHWARLAHAPAAAGVGLRRALAGVGATVTSMHWSLDTLELVAIVAAPDPASMATVRLAMAASGVFDTFITRQLLDATELGDVIGMAVAAGLVDEPAAERPR